MSKTKTNDHQILVTNATDDFETLLTCEVNQLAFTIRLLLEGVFGWVLTRPGQIAVLHWANLMRRRGKWVVALRKIKKIRKALNPDFGNCVQILVGN